MSIVKTNDKIDFRILWSRVFVRTKKKTHKRISNMNSVNKKEEKVSVTGVIY